MCCVADLNDEYIDKMVDVLSIYERPLDLQEPVICLDEKPERACGYPSTSGETRPGSPPGQ
jgi:hypothetical protein